MRRGLRFVHQGLGLINELDAVDNMALVHGYARRGLGRLDRVREALNLERSLARLGMSTDLFTPVGHLPPVERTAIAIARAVEDLHEAGGLLVLDEPTAALTPREVGRLFNVICELRAARVSILYVSHRMPEVFEVRPGERHARGARRRDEDTSQLDHDRLVNLMVGARSPGASDDSDIEAGRLPSSGVPHQQTPASQSADIRTTNANSQK